MIYTFGSGTIDAWEFVWLAEYVLKHNIQTVAEFGPGMSTYALLAGNVARIDTFECSSQWRQKALSEFRKIPSVRVRPYKNYEDAESVVLNIGQDRYDMVFVDSPPVMKPGSVPYARWNTVAAAALMSNRILLHDGCRERETKIAEHYEGLGWQVTLHKPGGRFHPPRGIIELVLPKETGNDDENQVAEDERTESTETDIPASAEPSEGPPSNF